jgi:hypothetical protein
MFIYRGSIVGETGHIITEYDPSGKLTFEVRFDSSTYPTYASYRTKWDHSIFRLSKDTLDFMEVIRGDSAYLHINVSILQMKL